MPFTCRSSPWKEIPMLFSRARRWTWWRPIINGRHPHSSFPTRRWNLFQSAGWGVWYAPDRPDAFLKTLFTIYGQTTYLIHARQAHEWVVAGNVQPSITSWVADSYNLVGFSVDSPGAPTFAQFFSPSPAHNHGNIYRLEGNLWRRVLDPATESMRSGEAFWILCKGSSRFQGPLDVRTTLNQSGVVMGAGSDTLVLRNLADHPLDVSVEHVSSGELPVPLSILITAVNGGSATSIARGVQTFSTAKPAGDWVQNLPTLEAGQALRFPLESRLQDMVAYHHSSILKITTDLGTETWLPVHALRKDLKED